MRLNLDSEQIDELYKTYLRQRESSKRYIEKHGGEMRETDISSKSDFITDLKSARADDRKASYSNLAKKLARDEVYISSTAKATASARAHAQMYGVEYSPGLVQAYRMNVEYQGETIWDNISEAYRNLRDQGLKSKVAREIIANEFFGGSP